MPSKNIVKYYEQDQYYHVYNRGVEKRVIFVDDQDYAVFLGLIKKFLTGERSLEVGSSNRHRFKHLGDEVDLISYCLMPNHYHLFLYQKTAKGISKFMRKLATGYSMYFNQKYNRVGSLYQGVYKASLISSDAYLCHISRYIHLNPNSYADYDYSSLKYFVRPELVPKWLKPSHVIDLFNGSPQEYAKFVDDYAMSDMEASKLNKLLADR